MMRDDARGRQTRRRMRLERGLERIAPAKFLDHAAIRFKQKLTELCFEFCQSLSDCRLAQVDRVGSRRNTTQTRNTCESAEMWKLKFQIGISPTISISL